MSPSVTAVIPHWYDERLPALRLAIRALQAGTVVPEILVWDNTATISGRSFDGVPVIGSPKNIGPKARFLAALTATSDYVFFQDNDMVVEKETIANLLDWADRDLGIVTLEGRMVGSRSYNHWPKIYGHGAAGPVKVAISLGRAELVLRLALPAILQNFPWSSSTVYDDLYFSWCAAQVGVPIHVVPAIKGVQDLRDLQTGVGLCTEPGYYERRDQVAQSLFGGAR